ncbi:hypothetical protein AO058_17205 [Salegentibacter sp. T436]|jgi:hypothetical protein|nr:hypothetical protein AO058_17205 [Salegentibacter sp. T436]
MEVAISSMVSKNFIEKRFSRNGAFANLQGCKKNRGWIKIVQFPLLGKARLHRDVEPFYFRRVNTSRLASLINAIKFENVF